MGQEEIISTFHQSEYIGISAGKESHSYLQIWGVVVNNQMLIRSWKNSENSWFHVLKATWVGTLQLGNETFPFSSKLVRDETLIDAIDRVYLDKYERYPSYAKDMVSTDSRDTTTEIIINKS